MSAALFATVDDVRVRLGYASMTGVQEAQARLALELASGLILEEVGKDQEWADALSPVPVAFRAVAIEVAVRVLNNPSAVDRMTKTIGAVSWSGDFGSAGFGLTEAEKGMLAVAVGAEVGSAKADSLITEFGEFYDTDRRFPNNATGVEGIYDDADA